MELGDTEDGGAHLARGQPLHTGRGGRGPRWPGSGLGCVFASPQRSTASPFSPGGCTPSKMRRFLRSGHDPARERLKRDLFQFNKVRGQEWGRHGQVSVVSVVSGVLLASPWTGAGGAKVVCTWMKGHAGSACSASWESDFGNRV